MYCSSCGVALAPGLSYCNYCGAKLPGKNDDSGKAPAVKPETLVAAMVFAFVFGLGAITVLMGVMKAVLHLEDGLILAFAMICFLTLLSFEAVFIRLLFRRGRNSETGSERPEFKRQATTELDAAAPRVLPDAIPSVTEHTTRAFEPIYSGQ